MSWMIAVTVLSLPLVLLLWGRRNERTVAREWQLLLTPKGERVYRGVQEHIHGQLELAELTYDEAFTVHELGSVDEVIRLLQVGYRVLERFSPSMLRLLAAMAAFSRMVSAMAPVRPLRPADFHLSQLMSLAYLNRILHQLLVSTGERFRLRLYILGHAFGLATRYLFRSTQRIVRKEGESDREWRQIKAIREDFKALTDESLESLRVLLTSLAAERREEVVELFQDDGFDL